MDPSITRTHYSLTSDTSQCQQLSNRPTRNTTNLIIMAITSRTSWISQLYQSTVGISIPSWYRSHYLKLISQSTSTTVTKEMMPISIVSLIPNQIIQLLSLLARIVGTTATVSLRYRTLLGKPRTMIHIPTCTPINISSIH